MKELRRCEWCGKRREGVSFRKETNMFNCPECHYGRMLFDYDTYWNLHLKIIEDTLSFKSRQKLGKNKP